ncbi:family 2 glycosyl transferase [Cohnella herbarum]|uniref:Family 2 glycosyl transferase n=1 Tax=Cohnella herbarum TaxID=2728023 RepID=A0A7Z2ZLA6_9BACL|nr:family 2 glycosyl transferase [Cohnella herbarum]QJD84081.1 family 2 glycosyl transferase [Cohnella herbarum]
MDHSAGLKDGIEWRGSSADDNRPDSLREIIHRKWNQRFLETNRASNTDWKLVQARGKSYSEGFMQGAGRHINISPVPLRNHAAAVVCAGTNEASLQEVLLQLAALPLQEVVIVLGKPSEWLFALARNDPKTVIAYLPEKVEPDIGRALGAKLTGADMILFVDGEKTVPADQLARFIWECEGKSDIALNDVSGQMGLFHQRGEIDRFHEFLNTSLNRGDLKINSLSNLPFAVSRNAFDTLGAAAFAIPVKAHALAILKGLRIGFGGSAGVRRFARNEDTEQKWRKAAGDHAEAWREAMSARGSRLQFADTQRNRSVLGEWEG